MTLRISEAKRLRILSLLKQGGLYRDIARTVHCGMSTVYKVNHARVGVKIRYGSRPRPMPPTVPEHSEGAPYCPVCHSAYRYPTDLLLGIQLEICHCGTKILSKGFAA